MFETDFVGPHPIPPSCRIGDRLYCLYRRCECVVSSFQDGPIPWPRGVRINQPHADTIAQSLIVTEDLARVIKTELSPPIRYWLGVGHGIIKVWRRAFGAKHKKPLIDDGLSRQQRYQARRIAAGLCGTCGEYPLLTKWLCKKCYARMIKSRRKKLGRKPLKGMGRPPKYKVK